MPRPRKHATGKPPLGKEGKMVSKQIIIGQRKRIRQLKVELESIEDPVQKRLLAEQIKREEVELRRFERNIR